MNIEEQKQVLTGIVSYLSSVSSMLESAVSDAHRLRDEADGDCPFAVDVLDEDLCEVIENLCDDVRVALGKVDELLECYGEEDEE